MIPIAPIISPEITLLDVNIPGLGWVEGLQVDEPDVFRPLFEDDEYHGCEVAALGTQSLQINSKPQPGQGCDVLVLATGQWSKGVVQSLSTNGKLAVRIRDTDTVAHFPVHTSLIRPFGSETGRGHRDNSLRWLIQRHSTSRPIRDDLILYEESLRKLGFECVKITGDGNCLFRAASHQIYGTEDHYDLIRQTTAEYMKIERAYFEPFVDCPEGFDFYLQTIAKDKVWGDDPEVQAISEIYNRPTVVYGFENQHAVVMRESRQGQPGMAPLRFSYYKGGHYDSVVPRGTTKPASAISKIPGVEEHRALEIARSRASGKLVKHIVQKSDEEATEEAQVNQAILQSRLEFDLFRNKANANYQEELSQALKESQHDADLQTAIQSSEKDLLSQVLQQSMHDDEDALVQLALHASLNDHS